MQKLGQHFLRNAETLRTIVDALALTDGDRVIEIGPGHGELTVPLAAAMRAAHEEHGGRGEITCIEKDHKLISALEILATNARGAFDKNDAAIKIIEGDALKLLPGLMTPGTKVVGNIPYYITGKLLRVIGELEHRPERTVLLIQKEVAERICAVPGVMNRLAASVQFWADAVIVARVPRADFSPPPEVDSAVIVLKNKTMPAPVDPALYYKTVRAIFAQPRKTLINNLSAGAAADAKSVGTGATKKEIANAMAKIGIDPGARPQDLDVRAIIAIARANLVE